MRSRGDKSSAASGGAATGGKAATSTARNLSSTFTSTCAGRNSHGAGGDDPDDERPAWWPPSPDDAFGDADFWSDSADTSSRSDSPPPPGSWSPVPAGYYPGVRPRLAPSPPRDPRNTLPLVDLGAPPITRTNSASTDLDSLDSSFSLAAVRRWMNHLPSTPDRFPPSYSPTSLAPSPRRAAPTPPPVPPVTPAGGGKRPAAFTPPSAEAARYRNVAPLAPLDPLPGLMTIMWSIEPQLYYIIHDFLVDLANLCTGEAEHDQPLVAAILSFLAAFSQATLRSYWARRGF